MDDVIMQLMQLLMLMPLFFCVGAMQGDEGKRDPIQDLKFTGNVFIFLIHAWAATHRCFFSVPGTCGRFYFGKQALVGMILPWVLITFWGPFAGGQYLIWHWWAMLAAFLVHRASTHAATRKGERIHSYYVGQSIFERMFPRWHSGTTKGLMELIAAVAIGALLLPVCEPLGAFIMGGGLANLIHLGLIQTRDERITQDAIDQQIEAEYHAARFRERQDS